MLLGCAPPDEAITCARLAQASCDKGLLDPGHSGRFRVFKDSSMMGSMRALCNKFFRRFYQGCIPVLRALGSFSGYAMVSVYIYINICLRLHCMYIYTYIYIRYDIHMYVRNLRFLHWLTLQYWNLTVLSTDSITTNFKARILHAETHSPNRTSWS